MTSNHLIDHYLEERIKAIEDFPFPIDITVNKKSPQIYCCRRCLNFEKSKQDNPTAGKAGA